MSDEKLLPCGHKATHHDTDRGPICWDCENAPGGPRFARVEDKDEKLVGYVDAPNGTHRLPAYIRDASTGKVYKAELDDFCTFACYSEITVATFVVKATHA